MKLEWLEDILAVIETGSFTAAAERRCLSPSAFTRRVRGMERALGCELFNRSRRPIVLLPHVQSMEVELRDMTRRLRALRLGLSGAEGAGRPRLTLGCQHALTTTVAPGLVRILGGAGQTELRIRSGSRSDCHQMLLRHEVDFGLIYETAEDALQFATGLFEKRTLGVDTLIPVANFRASPDLAGRLAARDLPLITYPADIHLGEVMRVHIMPALARGTTTYSVAETGLTPAVLQFLRQGLGIGWLPRAIAEEALAQGELTDLSDDLPQAPIHIRVARARGGNGSARAQLAWDALAESGAAQG